MTEGYCARARFQWPLQGNENSASTDRLGRELPRDGEVPEDGMFEGAGRLIDGWHLDFIWPLWDVFDTISEGRGTDWYPKLNYSS